MTFTKDEVNNTIRMLDRHGNQLNIFKLHGVIFIGNTEDMYWNLDKKYTQYSEHSIPISIEDFEDCEDKEDIRNIFSVIIRESIIDKLV